MASTDPGTASRLEEIESRIALQDHANLELSNEVYRQQRQIAALEQQVRELRERLASIELVQPSASPEDEVPPHY